MKKILTTAILSFILGVTVMFFISKNNKDQSTSKLQHLIGSTPRLFTNIGFAQAKHLAQQYKPGTIPARSDPGGPAITSNTQTIWFDITTLAELMNEVTNLPQGDGVRIYLATYDNNYFGFDSRGVKQNYSNANTVILVPTVTRAVDGKNYHWDLTDNGDSTKKVAYLATADFQNKGELCPPPSNCSLAGATLLP